MRGHRTVAVEQPDRMRRTALVSCSCGEFSREVEIPADDAEAKRITDGAAESHKDAAAIRNALGGLARIGR